MRERNEGLPDEFDRCGSDNEGECFEVFRVTLQRCDSLASSAQATANIGIDGSYRAQSSSLVTHRCRQIAFYL